MNSKQTEINYGIIIDGNGESEVQHGHKFVKDAIADMATTRIAQQLLKKAAMIDYDDIKTRIAREDNVFTYINGVNQETHHFKLRPIYDFETVKSAFDDEGLELVTTMVQYSFELIKCDEDGVKLN